MPRSSLLLTALLGLLLGASGCASNGQGPFQATYDEGLTNSEVIIQNDTGVLITVQLTGPTKASLKVKPHQSETVNLDPGTYTYKATADGVTPATGKASFAKKHRYTWTFHMREPKKGQR